jgi:deoxycytidylate deaminase
MNTNILQKATEFCLAQYNNIQHNYKHFSFIFRKTRLVAFGINAPYKTHPVALRFGHRFASIHSELAAILSFPYPNKELRDCRLINVRVDKYGKIKMSKPCKNCEPMLSWAGLKEIWYSTNNGGFRCL